MKLFQICMVFHSLTKELSNSLHNYLTRKQLTFHKLKLYVHNIPSEINCFSLLQAVRFYSMNGVMTSLNFVHSSIQEFLAALPVFLIITNSVPSKKN